VLDESLMHVWLRRSPSTRFSFLPTVQSRITKYFECRVSHAGTFKSSSAIQLTRPGPADTVW
jgi:hypothetical protein